MRTLLVLFAALWGLSLAPAAAAPPKTKPLTSHQDILKWINSYRAKREPQRLSETVRTMSDLGLFKDLDAAGIYIGFIAGVVALGGANKFELARALSGF